MEAIGIVLKVQTPFHFHITQQCEKNPKHSTSSKSTVSFNFDSTRLPTLNPIMPWRQSELF
jgi:hypothetical protein